MNLGATLFSQVAVFAILAWFTAKLVWPPLKRALDDRAATVAAAMEAADRGKKEMSSTSGRVEAQLAAARQEAKKLQVDYDRRAQTITEEARHTAEREAMRIIASARMEADQLLDRATAQLRAQVAEVAVVGAANILVREIDAAEHARMLVQLKDELAR